MFQIPVLNEIFPGDRDVIAMPRLDGPIRSGRHSGHSPELAVQVRLIAVAAVGRDCRPLDSSALSQPIDDGLEAPHAAERLRRESDRGAKQLDEALCPVSRLVPDLGDPRNRGTGVDGCHCVRNRRVHEQRPPDARQECVLDETERLFRRRRFENPLAHDDRGRAPEILERDSHAGKLTGRHAEEC